MSAFIILYITHHKFQSTKTIISKVNKEFALLLKQY